MRAIAERFIKNTDFTEDEFRMLVACAEDPEAAELLTQEAVRIRKKHYGDKVYIRGLIEFTNYCRNDCGYCGIRRGNRNAQRYRLTKEQILECCQIGYELGFRTFVLQGGEDAWFTQERLEEIVHAIRANYGDCAITLSLGERSRESYRRLFEAGADRYLLRHETADETHYASLHPPELSAAHRKQCLWDLKEIGYQTGTGFMVGSPGQTAAHLARDMMFIRELEPHMVGIGPFVPHHDTPFAGEMGGSVELVSINVDMKNGVVLDNEDMLTIDDEFSVDFRTRSDEQNGEVDSLAYMTDQQITDYFNSDNLIVYYTPKGMEIGFNFEDGWVTVTYEDYEQFLKVF